MDDGFFCEERFNGLIAVMYISNSDVGEVLLNHKELTIQVFLSRGVWCLLFLEPGQFSEVVDHLSLLFGGFR